MAASLRIEYVTFVNGARDSGVANNIIKTLHAAAALAVTTTVTTDGNRPVAPAFGDNAYGFAIIRALTNPVNVAWGDDPTAVDTPTGTPNDGKHLKADEEFVAYMTTGQLISAIEVA